MAADAARRARQRDAKPARGGQTAATIGSIAASGAGLLPDAVEGLAVAGTVTAGIAAGAEAMLLLPERANPGEEEALRQALAEHGGKPEALWFEPPPPSPPLPGLVPPGLPRTKPGEGGFTPASPGWHPEGFSPAPPPVLVHPGRPAVENKPTILESRKGGTTDGSRSRLAEVLMPDGQPIGFVNRGARTRVRTVTAEQFKRIKAELLADAKPLPQADDYDGKEYQLPSGAIVGIRESSDSGETIDIMKSDTEIIPNGFKVHRK